MDNFRVVIDWAVETVDPDPALRMVAALAVSGLVIGFAALEWAETTIEIPGARACPTYPGVAGWALWSATNRMDFPRAEAIDAEVAGILAERGTDDPVVARAQAALAFFRGKIEVAGRRRGLGRPGPVDRGPVRGRERIDHARRRADAHERP